jgi:hypothetical protein
VQLSPEPREERGEEEPREEFSKTSSEKVSCIFSKIRGLEGEKSGPFQ